jgi:hypothetical protein
VGFSKKASGGLGLAKMIYRPVMNQEVEGKVQLNQPLRGTRGIEPSDPPVVTYPEGQNRVCVTCLILLISS